MSNTYQGSCLCRGVQFSVSGFSEKAANCYCTMCRKFHGAAFGTLVGVQGLKWLSGEQLLKEFVAPNSTIRTFCSHCGSSLGFRVKNATPDDIELAVSTFDDDIPVKVDAQIYTSYKPNWCQLHANLQTFAEGREG
ncbi:GFA family protein [Photobacterium halotolerans]|uniref:GFA family protein n=1 Tax=Photobacterium halotolerans TaxID=265726 RepID=UPI0013732471|nr:GFA family protein [Photobacterium halotolerans]NAW87108.1 GFA family protein [Photobacterium halotolerans]